MFGVTLEYAASGAKGGAVIKPIEGWRCKTCQTDAIDLCWPEQIDELAELCNEEIRFFPEQGIYTPSYLELLANDDSYQRPSDGVTVTGGGMELRYGPQSETFCESLNLVSNWDVNYEHEGSYTLRVCPGPPYDLGQRRQLHALLHVLQVKLEAAIHFWSAHFAPYPGGKSDARFRLPGLLVQWGGDSDRAALALCNSFAVDAPPGGFVTSFRLLELLLNRMLDEDIARKRHDPGTSDAEFLELATTYRTDLKTRISRRVKSLKRQPVETLQALWKIAEPERTYNPSEVFDVIARFRNRFVHQPNEPHELPLPWEEPDFETFANLVLELASAMIEDRVDELDRD